MAKFKKINCSGSFTEQRLYLVICCWAKVDVETRPKYQARGGREGGREQKMFVSAANESTYKDVSETRKSKMPGGSSVSSLGPRSLKVTGSEIDQIVRVGSISCPIVQHR